MKRKPETIALRNMNVMFHRYVDTRKCDPRRRITIEIRNALNIAIVETLRYYGFKQGKRNEYRFTKWEVKQ